MTDPLDPERRLALAYVRAATRPAIEALWRLDVTLGSIVVGGSDPMVRRIRLAWWREALERLDREPAPGEPVLADLSEHLLPSGIQGAWLAAMADGWEYLLSPEPLGDEELGHYAAGRGRRLFEAAARLLGEADAPVGASGEAWALADLARRSRDGADAKRALAAARARGGPERWPVALRPIGMLAMLARRDARAPERLEPLGSPRRMARMIRHRLTGR